MRKGQAIFFVLFLLAVLAAISGALVIMWDVEIQARSSERDGLVALTLAEAAVERAKIELINNINLTDAGTCPGSPGCPLVCPPACPAPAPPYGYPDLDPDYPSYPNLAADNYIYYYYFRVDSGGAPAQRRLIGIGEVRDSTGGIVLGHREISITVDGITDSINNGTGLPPPEGIDDDGLAVKAPWSWREI